MKKRIVSLILCAAVIISACGCSTESNISSTDSSSSVSSAESVSQSDSSAESVTSSENSSSSDETSSDNSSDSKKDLSTDSKESSSAETSTTSSTSKSESGTSKTDTSAASTSSSTSKPAAVTEATTKKTTTASTKKQTADNPQSFSKVYEAESGKFSGGVAVISNDSASCGKSVGKFESDRSYCQIKINVPSDGIYDIVIRSMGIGSQKENDIYTDGKKAGTFTSENNKFSDYTVSAVSLTKGDHNIRIIKSWGWIELDKITVKTGAKISDSTYNVTSSLVNKNSTSSTKKLYQFLKDSYGKYVITGQQCDGGINGNEFKAIKNLTGSCPALLGLDMMDYTPSRTALGASSSAVEKAIEFANKGGIVTFCWHWNAPTEYLNSTANSSDGWWGGFYTQNSKFDIAKVMNGQDANGKKLLDRDIKEIAQQLKRLEKAGVPVIWRPLHEGSGGWFWWGAKGSDAYKKLWKYLYKELTDTYGCNNLIWVYNGQSADWYPGDEYVDIVGEDIYPGKHVYDPQVSRFKQAINYGSKTKIAALTENGCIFDIDSAAEINALWSWFMTWGGEFTSNGSNYSETYTEKSIIKKMYSSKYALTLDDLPNIY